MFCVKCGKEDVETIDGLCRECYLEGRKFISLPHHVDLMRCTSCEEYFLNDQWLRRTEDEAVEGAALGSLTAMPDARAISVGTMVEKQEDRTFLVHVQADIDVLGHTVTDEDSTIVRLKNTVCKKCSRQLGSYYEAIVQIRSGGKSLSNELRDEVVCWITSYVENQSRTNRFLFITKMQEVQGGVDIYLSSISLGKTLERELSEMYGADTKESASLVGVSNDGQEVHRVTFLIRLPLYHIGDIIQFGEGPFLLTALNKNGGKMTDLRTFRKTSIKKFELLTVKVMVKAKDVKDAIVVSKSQKEIQVLHPRNYFTVDLAIPGDAEIGDSARVADIDGELFFVP